MAVLKAKDLRAMSKEERSKKLGELKAELAKIRAKASMGGAEKPANMRNIRHDIARILTVSSQER